MPQVTKKILKKYGHMSETEKGWRKELNLVSWNDREPRFDIREWAPDHEKMGKGVTFRQSEFLALKKMLIGMDIAIELPDNELPKTIPAAQIRPSTSGNGAPAQPGYTQSVTTINSDGEIISESSTPSSNIVNFDVKKETEELFGTPEPELALAMHEVDTEAEVEVDAESDSDAESESDSESDIEEVDDSETNEEADA